MHARMGHVSLSKMRHIEVCNCKGVHEYNCNICLISKFHKLPFKVSQNRAKSCFDLVHIDLWGPYRVKSLSGASYFATILDDFSRST